MQILLVEDDLFFQKFYASKLKEAGIDAVLASNGQEAIQKLAEIKPQLILLDLIMPIMDGFEVLNALSQNTNWKNIPVLVFSTLGQEADIAKAKHLGAKDYVNKSFFDFDTLHTKIKELVNAP